MRDWLKPFLVTCIAVLGVAVFILEHRVSNLESQLSAARSGITVAKPFEGSPTGVVQSRPGDALLRQSPDPAIELDSLDAKKKALQQQLTLQWKPQRQRPGVVVPPNAALPIPRLERRPSGEINGIPYYHIELSQADR